MPKKRPMNWAKKAKDDQAVHKNTPLFAKHALRMLRDDHPEFRKDYLRQQAEYLGVEIVFPDDPPIDDPLQSCNVVFNLNRLYERAIREADGVYVYAAGLLGINVRTLYRWRKQGDKEKILVTRHKPKKE